MRWVSNNLSISFIQEAVSKQIVFVKIQNNQQMDLDLFTIQIHSSADI